MMTAVPVEFFASGTYGVSDGLWTLLMLEPSICSASVLRASDPGAPWGQSGMAGGRSLGIWAKSGAAVQRNAIPTRGVAGNVCRFIAPTPCRGTNRACLPVVYGG